MAELPSKAVVQKLIASHPDGVRGEPMAVGWSTHKPGTLVVIDSVGHKLVFAEVKSSGEAKCPSRVCLAQSGSTNEAKEIQKETPNESRTRAAAPPNKAQTSGEKTTNKPKPVGARPASPAKDKAKP